MPTFDLGLVKGPKGDPGGRGEQGIQGPVGPQGPKGDPASVNGISPDDSGNITLTAGDVGAYSKTETNTLLQNKAPAGYGLGTNFNELPGADDANLITKFGYYAVNENTPTGDWCYVLHLPYGDNRATQFAFIGYAALNDIKYCYCKREKINDEWKPWEWVNPPMLLGVEYRTTERYLGKPVYTQVITVDGGVAGTLYQTEKIIDGADQLVGYDASLWDWSIPTNIFGGVTGNQQNIIDATARVSSSHVLCYFYSPGRDTTGSTAYFTVRYTKSTN